MEIHRFESVWIVASLLLIAGWIATVTYGAVGPPGIEMVDEAGGTIADPANPAESPNFEDPGVYETGEDRYAVYVVARQFLFEPGTGEPIRLPAGSTVTFYITSADVIHGFQLAGTNVNAMVIPGQVTKITVRFDREAEYGIVCNEFCGAGHHTMEGQVVVVSRSAFEGGA